MFPLDSIFVTGRPSRRLPHVIFRCRHTDLFVLLRLPQFSNNFTTHVERAPTLAFRPHGFPPKNPLLPQPPSPLDCPSPCPLARPYSHAPHPPPPRFTPPRLPPPALL